MLGREDLSREVRPFVNRLEEAAFTGSNGKEMKATLVTHPLHTSGIDYLTFMFDISDLPQKFFPYLGVFKTLLGVLDTEHYSYAELDREINIYTGGVGPTVSVYTRNANPSDYRMTAEVNCKTLHENLQEAIGLVKEILTSTKWNSRERILEVLEEERAAMRAELPSSGHATAAVRAMSCISETSLIMDCVNGVNAYRTLDEVCGLLEKNEADDLIAMLSEMAQFIFRQNRMMVDCTADESSMAEITEQAAQLGRSLFPAAAPEEDLAGYGPKFAVSPVKVKEGFTTAGQVQFVCRAGSFGNKGLAYTGAMRVLRVILGYDYLWNNVRVTGGAYGCMSSFSRDGFAYFVSYRDPHLKRTIGVFEDAPAYIRSFDADERAMTKYIIGAVGALDHPMTPSTYGKYSLTAYMTGLTEEKARRERAQVLDCQPADIRALAAQIEAFLSDDCLCVVGSDEKIRAEKDRFDKLVKLQ